MHHETKLEILKRLQPLAQPCLGVGRQAAAPQANGASLGWRRRERTRRSGGPTALNTKEVPPHLCDESGLPLQIQGFGAAQFEAFSIEAETTGERDMVRDQAGFAPELVRLRVADHEIVGHGVTSVSHRFAAHLAVGDFAVKMEAFAAALADEVVGENLSPRIVLVDAVAGGVPDNVVVHQIRHRGRLDKNRAVPRVAADDNIFAAARVAVIPIHPDAGAVRRVGDEVAADEAAHVAVGLDATSFPQQFGVVPGIAHHDVILDEQAELASTSAPQPANAADAAVGHDIPADDVEADLQRLRPVRMLDAEVQAHPVHLAHGAVFDDPVMAARGGNRADLFQRERPRHVLDDKSLHANEPQAVLLGSEDGVLRGQLNQRAARSGVTGKTRVQNLVGAIHPEGAGVGGQGAQLRHLDQPPPVLKD